MGKPTYEQATNFGAELAKTRAGIAELKEKIEYLENAPLPLGEAKQAADALIKDLSGRGGLNNRMSAFFLPNRHGDHVKDTFRQQGETWDGLGKCFVDGGPLLVALFPDLVKARLYSLLEAQAETLECGPPSADRKTQRAALEKRLFECEIQEERLIEEAEAAGVEIYRRADVNPAAVIGIF